MKLFPLQNYSESQIPKSGSGSFGENRGDRIHTGVDLYAPKGSIVCSVESAIVIASDIFTSPQLNNYWNITYFVAVKNHSGNICKYCELGDIFVSIGQQIQAGVQIGAVGSVLNFDLIDENSPLYIQQIKQSGRSSMLHFELYSSPPITPENYSGGNIFSPTLPNNLLNPTDFMINLL
jgi:murein DD-endopeptidase MepM/ murein hydrolase activator NlpD